MAVCIVALIKIEIYQDRFLSVPQISSSGVVSLLGEVHTLLQAIVLAIASNSVGHCKQ